MYNEDSVPNKIPTVIMNAKLKIEPPPTNNKMTSTDRVVAVVITVRPNVFCNASLIKIGHWGEQFFAPIFSNTIKNNQRIVQRVP